MPAALGSKKNPFLGDSSLPSAMVEGRSQPPIFTQWSIPAVLFLLVLATKLLFLHGVVADPQLLFYDPDSQGYYRLAINLLENGVFSASPEPPLLPDNLRTPIYPLFLAALFALFGTNLVAVATAQILISAATAVAIYLFARRLDGSAAAVVAALLFGLDLSGFVYAHALLTETLFTLLFLVAVVVLAKALRKNTWLLYAFAGLLAGFATLCRPVGLYFFVPAIGLILVWAAGPWRQRVAFSLLFFTAFGLALSPWMVRNKLVFGVTNVSGVHNVLLNATYLEADRLGISVEEAESLLERELEAALAGRELNPAERYQAYQRLGLSKILAHPWRYGWVHLKGMLPSMLDNNVRDLGYFRGRGRTFFGARDLLVAGGPVAALRSVWGSKRRGYLLLFAAATLVLLLLYAFAVWGAAALWRKGRRPEVALLAFSIAYLLFVTAPAGSVRFRFPAMPYIDVLAGAGIIAAWDRWKERRGRGRS